MIPLVIKKRTVLVALVVLVLVTVLTFAFYFAFARRSGPAPGVPVDGAAPGMVRFEMAPGVTPDTPARLHGGNSPSADGFFVDLKIERDKARGLQAAWLKEVINDGSSSSEMKQRAQQELITLTRNIGRELELESMVKAKGYQDAAVMLENSIVTVIVAAPRLLDEEADSIIQLISRAAGVEPKNVMVVQKNQT